MFGLRFDQLVLVWQLKEGAGYNRLVQHVLREDMDFSVVASWNVNEVTRSGLCYKSRLRKVGVMKQPVVAEHEFGVFQRFVHEVLHHGRNHVHFNDASEDDNGRVLEQARLHAGDAVVHWQVAQVGEQLRGLLTFPAHLKGEEGGELGGELQHVWNVRVLL